MIHRLRNLGFVLALTLVPLTVEAQKKNGGGDPPSTGCQCAAGGADCLFGSIEGCEISCSYSGCECVSANCILGFPSRARCRCLPGVSA
jgi:hypothetical protein